MCHEILVHCQLTKKNPKKFYTRKFQKTTNINFVHLKICSLNLKLRYALYVCTYMQVCVLHCMICTTLTTLHSLWCEECLYIYFTYTCSSNQSQLLNQPNKRKILHTHTCICTYIYVHVYNIYMYVYYTYTYMYIHVCVWMKPTHYQQPYNLKFAALLQGYKRPFIGKVNMNGL